MSLLAKFKPVHEQRMLLLALAAGLPAVAVSMYIVWTHDYQPKEQWTLSVLILGV